MPVTVTTVVGSADEVSVGMTGAEDTLFEVVGSRPTALEVWADLSVMQLGDMIIVRYYRRVKAGGIYSKYAEETYSNVQALPMLCILQHQVYRDTKVTAQQTAGAARSVDVQAIRR